MGQVTSTEGVGVALIFSGIFLFKRRMGRHCSKAAELIPRGASSLSRAGDQGKQTGSARGEVRTTGSLAEIATETPDSAEKPPARMLPGTPFSRPGGRVQPVSCPEGSGPTSHPAVTRASAHPSLSGCRTGLAAAASAPHRQEQSGSWGLALGGVPWARARCPAKRTLASFWGSRGHTRPPLSTVPVGPKPCRDRRPEPDPASAQSWRWTFTSVSSWQPVS